MRKWILLAFAVGFIAGGVALFFALPQMKDSKPVLKVEAIPNEEAVFAPSEAPIEDLGAPPAAIITEDEGKPTPFAAPDSANDAMRRDDSPDPEQLPPDSDPDDGIQDLSNDLNQ